jgi:hypothetical protein
MAGGLCGQQGTHQAPEPGIIRIVANEAFANPDGVDRADAAGFRGDRIEMPHDGSFVWNGDIDAGIPLGPQGGQQRLKRLRFTLQQRVAAFLAVKTEPGLVNLRAAAVGELPAQQSQFDRGQCRRHGRLVGKPVQLIRPGCGHDVVNHPQQIRFERGLAHRVADIPAHLRFPPLVEHRHAVLGFDIGDA